MTRKELTDLMDTARAKAIEEIKAARLRSDDLLRPVDQSQPAIPAMTAAAPLPVQPGVDPHRTS
jgi:hypothetical protein